MQPLKKVSLNSALNKHNYLPVPNLDLTQKTEYEFRLVFETAAAAGLFFISKDSDWRILLLLLAHCCTDNRLGSRPS